MRGSHVMFSSTTADQLVQTTASCFRNQSVFQQINHSFIPTISLRKQIIIRIGNMDVGSIAMVLCYKWIYECHFSHNTNFSSTASKLILYRILNDTQPSTHEWHKGVVLYKQECIPVRCVPATCRL